MIESVAAMASFFFVYWLSGWRPGMPMASSGTVYLMATTMTLGAIVFSQIGVVFNCRTERASIFKVGFFTNRMVLIGIACELTLLSLYAYVPLLHGLFNTAPIGVREWAFLLIWAPMIFLLDEVRKAFARRRGHHTATNMRKSGQEAA
jgi:magnesium-transporting ATPase (P-type)